MSTFSPIGLPKGASFAFYETVGIEQNQYYLYMPSHPNMTFTMSPMLNSLIYLFTDEPVADLRQAWAVFERSGLMELSEKEAVFVAIPVPMDGVAWSEADYKNYYNIQYVLSGGHIEFHGAGSNPILQYERYVYNNQQYVVGEGRGATFINNILSQKCNRIAAAATFGGEMDAGLTGRMPLPVYAVDPCQNAITYYQTVNETNTVQDGSYVNDGYPLKKVTVKHGGVRFDQAHLLDAWNTMFSHTARVCIDDNIVCSNLSAKIWVLQERPNYEELGINTIEHTVDGYLCYDLLPEGLPESAPLVISCHGGGDDCLYHVNSCGWTAKCAEEKFILISPDFPSGTRGTTLHNEEFGYSDFRPIADHIKKVLDYALETYSVDRRRIYIAGFSMGSSVTAATALRYLDQFAACCVMGGTGYNNPWYEHHVNTFKKKYDMPFIIISGDKDVMSMDTDFNGNSALFGVHSNGLPINGIDRLLEINKLPYDCADYAKYPLWGYPVDRVVTRTDKELNYHVGSIYRSDREPPIAQLITFENAGHAHSSFFATLCWDFLSQYARGEDGRTIALTNHYG